VTRIIKFLPLVLPAKYITTPSSARMDEPESSSSAKADSFYGYFGSLKNDQLPIIYSDNYNISFYGLEKLHPFDRYEKWDGVRGG
jgi:hypothetical protein